MWPSCGRCSASDSLALEPQQVSVIRESVASVYEAEESWTQAAHVLAGIDLDSGQRVLDAVYKLQMCIRIAQLFLVCELCGVPVIASPTI